MTLTQIMQYLENKGIELTVIGDDIQLHGNSAAIDHITANIKSKKHELLCLFRGDDLKDVGTCTRCKGQLIGWWTADQFVNRECPDCGQNMKCWSKEELTYARRASDENKKQTQASLLEANATQGNN